MFRLRIFVLWIAMFAIPFQGYAAAAMVFCEPSDASNVVVMEHDKGHGASAHNDDGRSADGHFDATHKCSTCGACHATALAPALQTVSRRDLTPADLAEPFFTMATLTLSVPDKPPRI